MTETKKLRSYFVYVGTWLELLVVLWSFGLDSLDIYPSDIFEEGQLGAHSDTGTHDAMPSMRTTSSIITQIK